MIKKLIPGVLAAAVGITLASCGETKENETKEDDDDEAPFVSGTATPKDELPSGIGTLAISGGISELPNVTDSVNLNQDPDTSNFDSNTGTLAIGDLNLMASTGINFSKTKTNDMQAKGNPAYGACEMVNRARGFLDGAAKPDVATCELSFLLGDSTDFYDGEFHIFEFVDPDMTEHYKFKIDGTKDNVTGLTFYRCEDGKQFEYIKKTIAEDNTVSIVAKRASEPDNPQVDRFRGVVKLAGKADENGQLSGVKNITQWYSNNFSDGSISYFKEQVLQSSANLQYAGYTTQTNREDPDRFLAFMELLDSSPEGKTDLRELALGDGAMVFSKEAGKTTVQGWDGDTWLVDNNVPQFEKVAAAKALLPDAPDQSEVSLDFEGDEAWDCTGEPDLILDEATFEELLEEAGIALQGEGQQGGGEGHHGGEDDEDDLCREYMLPQNQYIECHQFADFSGE